MFPNDFRGMWRLAKWDMGAIAATWTSPPIPPLAAPTGLHVVQAAIAVPSGPPPTNDLSGLILWWPFEEGSGATTVDASGNGNTGNLNNAPVWTGGIITNAISFNGSNQGIDGPNPYNGTGPITICAWVRASSPDFNTTATVLSSGYSYGFMIYNGTYAFVGDGGWYDGIPVSANASAPIDPDDGELALSNRDLEQWRRNFLRG